MNENLCLSVYASKKKNSQPLENSVLVVWTKICRANLIRAVTSINHTHFIKLNQNMHFLSYNALCLL